MTVSLALPTVEVHPVPGLFLVSSIQTAKLCALAIVRGVGFDVKANNRQLLR
jgi:hypothetical protein